MSKKRESKKTLIRLHPESLFDEDIISLKELHKIHILTVEKYINFCDEVEHRLENVTRKIDFENLAKSFDIDPKFGITFSFTNFIIPLDKTTNEYMWNTEGLKPTELDVRRLVWFCENTINDNFKTINSKKILPNIKSPLTLLCFLFELYYNVTENTKYDNCFESTRKLALDYKIDIGIIRFLEQEKIITVKVGKITWISEKTPSIELAKRLLNLKYYYKLDDKLKTSVKELPLRFKQYEIFNNDVTTLKLTKKARQKVVETLIKESSNVPATDLPLPIKKEVVKVKKEDLEKEKNRLLKEPKKENTVKTISLFWGLIKIKKEVTN